MEVLQRLTSLKQQLDELRPLNAETEAAILQKFRLDWNFHSNHLEGNTLTYGETRALILFGVTASGKPLKDHFEITGHNEAIKWIEEVVREDRELTENFIRQLHTLILEKPYYKNAKTPEGQPRKKLVHVGEYKKEPNHVETVTGEIFYFASPEETPAMMHDLMEWYRAKKEELHPLLLAAEFHYKFIRIHPFDDGNGRTARLLMNFILMQNAYPPVVIRTDDKENYFAVLRQADAGNLEPFIEYIGDNLEYSLTLMLKGAKGEPIDEPDDVDKEIALLRKRLSSLEQSSARQKVDLTYVFKLSVKKLFEAFKDKGSKFDHFYFNNYFFGVPSRIKEDIPGYKKIINGFDATGLAYLKDIDKILSNEDFNRLRSFEILCYHKNFKNLTIQSFDYESGFDVFFGGNSYKIESKNTDEHIIKNYTEILEEEEINRLIRSETKAHTDFINQKIEEAQKSDK